MADELRDSDAKQIRLERPALRGEVDRAAAVVVHEDRRDPLGEHRCRGGERAVAGERQTGVGVAVDEPRSSVKSAG